jgi:hypothetical protein
MEEHVPFPAISVNAAAISAVCRRSKRGSSWATRRKLGLGEQPGLRGRKTDPLTYKTLKYLVFLDFSVFDPADIYPLAQCHPSGINIVILSPWRTSPRVDQ